MSKMMKIFGLRAQDRKMDLSTAAVLYLCFFSFFFFFFFPRRLFNPAAPAAPNGNDTFPFGAADGKEAAIFYFFLSLAALWLFKVKMEYGTFVVCR